MKSQKPITERIKTLKDIFKVSQPDPDELKLISYKGKNKRLLGAQTQLIAEHITEVYNEGTILDWDNNDQKKWFGWYDIEKGSGFDRWDCDCWTTESAVSSRLHFKEKDLFWDAVNKFPKIYKTLMVK